MSPIPNDRSQRVKYIRNYKTVKVDSEIYKGSETWDRRKIVWTIINENPGLYRYEICEAYSKLTHSVFNPKDDRNFGCACLKYIPELMRAGYLERIWERKGKNHRVAYYTTAKVPKFPDLVDTFEDDSWNWVGEDGQINRR